MLKQAVILCGGIGSRLRPFTDNTPKPMVQIGTKPFLYYLLQQIAEQGISEFIILTGYKHNQIVDYFGDGKRFGWSINYSHGSVEWETGKRIWEARKIINNNFLLMYSDNFVNISLHNLKRHNKKFNKDITLTICHKGQKGNVKIDNDLNFVSYSRERRLNFNYVEVGYMLVNRKLILDIIKDNIDINFSYVLETLSNKFNKKIHSFLVRSGYNSISDVDRYNQTKQLFEEKKIILIDRDGTINEKAPKGEYIKNWEKIKFIDNTVTAMQDLSNLGYKFIVITNQAGIARGMVERKEVKRIHENMKSYFQNLNVKILDVFLSDHHWNEGSFMRKPEPGMFFEAAVKYSIRLNRTLYIGDDLRDLEAANNAGCGMVLLTNKPINLKVYNVKPLICVKQLSEAINKINNSFKEWYIKDYE